MFVAGLDWLSRRLEGFQNQGKRRLPLFRPFLDNFALPRHFQIREITLVCRQSATQGNFQTMVAHAVQNEDLHIASWSILRLVLRILGRIWSLLGCI